ncbi:hypothetical protein [Methyloraptor flagellatus]|jgi:hypothetical protein|uniref:Uncharacterized protein n=1 Tax=Methyloraptor flagellatus TaxID=3162530 RepID=A0AAU7X5I6_9HYPH
MSETKVQEQQFEQSTPKRKDKVDLGQQYKSVGISAVAAAASFRTPKPKKPNNQMS